ncbi:MAG: nicotinate (nicotinamide) nucleotide adenylyltransferase [Pseudomonadota bacterium]
MTFSSARRPSLMQKQKKRSVGLLGGSFNPAHDGHLTLSYQCRNHFKLDQIWWLVSPQNPLKKQSGSADYAVKFQHAKRLTARYPWLKIVDFEAVYGFSYSIDTITKLLAIYRKYRFIWLMGADNLKEFHQWHQWQKIVMQITLGVYTRPYYDYGAISSPAASYMQKWRMPEKYARTLQYKKAPSWCFIHARCNAISSSQIRQSGLIKPLNKITHLNEPS